jgi:hypothetical protein
LLSKYRVIPVRREIPEQTTPTQPIILALAANPIIAIVAKMEANTIITVTVVLFIISFGRFNFYLFLVSPAIISDMA